MNILVVDDEAGIRAALDVVLRLAGHTVTFARDCDEAVPLVNATQFDLIITDHQMERSTGLDLVRQLRSGGFDGEIIVLTAYADSGDVEEYKTLRIAGIMEKPFNVGELRHWINCIHECGRCANAGAESLCPPGAPAFCWLRRDDPRIPERWPKMHPEINFNEILERASQLPAFSATTVRLIKLVSDGDYDLSDIVDVVKYDQALSFKLLCAANTAYCGTATGVSTAQEAVARLGATQVVALAVASGVRPLLQAGLPAYGLPQGQLWQHSVSAAVVSEVAPSCCNVTPSAEVFTAALLHDIGKLVMGHFIKEDVLKKIVQVREEDHLTFMEAELRVFGIHHAELGGLIAEHWTLPANVVEGIRFHHNPAQSGNDVSYFVNLANCIAHRLGQRPDSDPEAAPVSEETAAKVGLDPDGYENLCTKAAAKYAKISALYDAV